MAGQVKCKTCGMAWADRLEYMKDEVKCGSDSCPHKSTGRRKSTQAIVVPIFTQKNRRKKELTQEVSTSTVQSEVDPTKVDWMMAQVPKVIVTKLSYK